MIKRAGMNEAGELADLAIKMWTDHDPEDLAKEFHELAMNDEAVSFIKFVDDQPVGFAQCQLRHDYVEGTETSPVGYLEGIFVSEGYRKKGYAAELLSECEKWAKEKAAANLPAIVNSIMRTVSGSIWLWDLRKQIGSYASKKNCSFVMAVLLKRCASCASKRWPSFPCRMRREILTVRNR